jgi:hypothetical protein
MERLGWETSCPEVSCPQTWLTLSVQELPTQISCESCGRVIHLCPTEAAFRHAPRPSAWPVVPPIGLERPARDSGPTAPQEDGIPEALLDGPPPDAEPEPLPVRQPAPSPKRPARRWVLHIESSPSEPIRVDKDTMVIGRSRTCDVILPSAKVSRQHASLSVIEGDLFIEDLGSANGVWRNGHRVAREKLAPGDVVVLSDETLRFEWA